MSALACNCSNSSIYAIQTVVILVTTVTVMTLDSLYQQSAIFSIRWAMGQCRVGPCLFLFVVLILLIVRWCKYHILIQASLRRTLYAYYKLQGATRRVVQNSTTTTSKIAVKIQKKIMQKNSIRSLQPIPFQNPGRNTQSRTDLQSISSRTPRLLFKQDIWSFKKPSRGYLNLLILLYLYFQANSRCCFYTI